MHILAHLQAHVGGGPCTQLPGTGRARIMVGGHIEERAVAKELTRVFVSYARRDFYFAEQLAVALRRHDVAAWFDGHELASGTDWSAGIDQAITHCDAMVLVASPAALESPYVRSEYGRAVQQGRPVVAVRCSKRSPPQELDFPVYDLRCSFRRGVAALADDLVGRHLYGRVCRGFPSLWGPSS